MEHRIEPLGHGTDQADQGFSVNGFELVPTGGSPEGVMTTPLPQLNPVGELRLQTHLLACPNHRFPTIEVESLDGEQQKVETLDAPPAETCAVLGGT